MFVIIFNQLSEIHQAAKETVALAEARFLSKQHEWKFDSAWQEMLNNAILKVIFVTKNNNFNNFLYVLNLLVKY